MARRRPPVATRRGAPGSARSRRAEPGSGAGGTRGARSQAPSVGGEGGRRDSGVHSVGRSQGGPEMGIIRKSASIATLGIVPFRLRKELLKRAEKARREAEA